MSWYTFAVGYLSPGNVRVCVCVLLISIPIFLWFCYTARERESYV